MAKWHPVLRNAAKIGSQFFGFLHGGAIGHTDQQLFPVSRCHAPSQEPDQLVVLMVGKAVSQLGKGLPSVIGNVSISEIMIFVDCFHLVLSV